MLINIVQSIKNISINGWKSEFIFFPAYEKHKEKIIEILNSDMEEDNKFTFILQRGDGDDFGGLLDFHQRIRKILDYDISYNSEIIDTIESSFIPVEGMYINNYKIKKVLYSPDGNVSLFVEGFSRKYKNFNCKDLIESLELHF